jgi:16S rRNA G966 N2-methylase RsmD
LWLLDSNRLLCGNAKDKADLRKLMGREHATMVFTDPPFTRNRIDLGSSPNTIRDARDVGRIDCARTALA